MHSRQLVAGLALVSAGALACRTTDSGPAAKGQVGGTLVIAIPTNIETLLPPAGVGGNTAQVLDLVFDYLADRGDSLSLVGDHGFTPRLSDHWTWASDSLSIAFHIDPRARWHDGAPVSARDVRFTYKLYMDSAMGAAVASNMQQIDSVTTADSMTAVFWFKRRYPTQFFDASQQIRICPEHLLGPIKVADMRGSEFARHPIGSGPYRFASWEPNASLAIIADTANYRGRPNLDRIVWDIAPNYAAALIKVKSGEADMYEIVHPEDVPDITSNPGLRAITYPQPSYAFMGLNLKRPMFADRRVRRALAMALDRQSMVRNTLDTLGRVAIGLFSRLSTIMDTTLTPLPYDTAAADRLLDSAGWRRGPNGVRSRGGQPLAFELLVPSSSKYRVRMAVLIQDQLQRIGVTVTPREMEQTVQLSRMRAHDFDASLASWISDLSPNEPNETWTTLAETNGLNFFSYSNHAFDAAIDSAIIQLDPVKAKVTFSHAYAILIDDAPGIALYEPKLIAALNKRFHTRPFRADGWWFHLPEWYIPAGERTARDRVGLAAAAH